MALPFPVLIDRDRDTYRAYGLTRALHLFQESATFLIERGGVVRHAVHAHNPNASMDWDALLVALQALDAGEDADEDVGERAPPPAPR